MKLNYRRETTLQCVL